MWYAYQASPNRRRSNTRGGSLFICLILGVMFFLLFSTGMFFNLGDSSFIGVPLIIGIFIFILGVYVFIRSRQSTLKSHSSYRTYPNANANNNHSNPRSILSPKPTNSHTSYRYPSTPESSQSQYEISSLDSQTSYSMNSGLNCSYCGYSVELGIKFCPNCGGRQS